MKIWVIGDIHGCYASLMKLLEKLDLDRDDRVISVGDLINRGPDSQLVMNLFVEDRRFDAVLGNHEWTFIRWFYSDRAYPVKDFEELSRNRQAEKWIHWLKERPVLLSVGHDVHVVHAGLWPFWSIDQHQTHARKLEGWIQKATPQEWSQIGSYFHQAIEDVDDVIENQRIAFLANVFFHMRFLRLEESKYILDLKRKDGPNIAQVLEDKSVPWYEIQRHDMNRIHKIIFGHWASLGGVSSEWYEGIDTACIWGKHLTAYEIYSGRKITQQALERQISQGD